MNTQSATYVCKKCKKKIVIYLGVVLRTCVNFPLTILNDSNVARKLWRLLSLSIWRCVWENCNCLMWTPFVENKSCERDVTERSKSYTDNDWMGDDISWSIERIDAAVVPGHSRYRPILKYMGWNREIEKFKIYTFVNVWNVSLLVLCYGGGVWSRNLKSILINNCRLLY